MRWLGFEVHFLSKTSRLPPFFLSLNSLCVCSVSVGSVGAVFVYLVSGVGFDGPTQ